MQGSLACMVFFDTCETPRWGADTPADASVWLYLTCYVEPNAISSFAQSWQVALLPGVGTIASESSHEAPRH